MAESPSSTATPTTIDHAALARQVVEMLLQGGTIAECASEIDAFGGSMLAVHECLDRGMEPGAVRRVVRGQQEARAVRLETLKTAVLHELWLLAFGEETPSRGLTADEMRAIEARRRACVSLLQLKPFQNATGARDSVQDVPTPRFFDDDKRNHSRDDCATDEWGTDSATRSAATRPKEGERGGTSNYERRTTSDEHGSSDELRVTNDEYGSNGGDDESHSREFVNRDDAIETLANDDPSLLSTGDSQRQPASLAPQDEEERTPHLTRQQLRKRTRDQRKREHKKPNGLKSDGSDATCGTPSADRLEGGVGDDAHPP